MQKNTKSNKHKKIKEHKRDKGKKQFISMAAGTSMCLPKNAHDSNNRFN